MPNLDRLGLFDLASDPHEFCHLADPPEYAATLTGLQHQLTAWREETNAPLLDPRNLKRRAADAEPSPKHRVR